MEYADFYDIAVYGNKYWKGSFTPKETACNAYTYYADYEWSIEHNELADDIVILLQYLKEDLLNMSEDDFDYEEVIFWITEIEEPFQKGK